MRQRIVITGLGVISSIGIGKDDFWKNLIQGKSGISEVSSFDTSKHATHVGGEVKNFKPEEFISRNRLKLTGRTSQFAIAAVKLALADANLGTKAISNLRASVCLGTTMGEIKAVETADHAWIESRKAQSKINIMDIYQSPVNNIPANVAIEFKLKGRNRIFTTACASGNYAIGFGFDLLRFNEADIVIAGGADAFSWISFTGFNKIGAASSDKCRPFDKNRKGMIPGEGAGVLILESLHSALNRNAPIYAEILGYGLSCDAFHMTNSQVDGIAECMRNSLKEANISKKNVDYICAHGTGTIHNDRTECAAIKKVFGNHKTISSIKSMLGHAMGAASAIEAISCCLTIKNNLIPPTINYETADPECNIDCVPNTARRQNVNIALNNAFAFGGNNSCLVLKKLKLMDE